MNKAIKVLGWYTAIIETVSILSLIYLLLTGQSVVFTSPMIVLNTILSTPVIALAILVLIRIRH